MCACATSPIKRYPGFSAKARTIKKFRVLSDFTLLTQIPSQRFLEGTAETFIDVAQSKKVGDATLQHMALQLKECGYKVADSSISCVGCIFADSTSTWKIRDFSESSNANRATFHEQRLPAYIAEELNRSTSTAELLQKSFVALRRYSPESEIKEAYPSVVALNRSRTEDAALFVSAVWEDSSQIHLIPLTVVSPVLMRLWIVDVSNGEVLWSDFKMEKHGGNGRAFFDVQDLAALANALIAQLPRKY